MLSAGTSGLTAGLKLQSGHTLGVEKLTVDSGFVSARLYLEPPAIPPNSSVSLSMKIFEIFSISLDALSITVERNAITEWVISGALEFPAFWNHDKNGSTAEIRATDLHFGTGGFSGTLALQAKKDPDTGEDYPDAAISCNFGQDSEAESAKKFGVSLTVFSLTFKHGAITDSRIKGSLTIPGFKTESADPAVIEIDVAIHQNGDFEITGAIEGGVKLHLGKILDVTVKSLFLGKHDDDFCIGVSGSIKFTTELLKDLAPIEVEKLLIWSDGRFEIEGGTIPLPKNIRFPIGPAEISITAIHLGSHQQENDGVMRQYRYFGFDGGVDINPGGVDVRGSGIKFYFTVDGGPFDSYLEIKSIAIDLVIPGSASKETATVLISGFLSVGKTASGDPEYEGGIRFALPKAKIAGGASMKLRPKVPAFLVDAFVELSTPIPLGATGLGIFGFRGLIGQRYVPTKEAAQLVDPATKTWFDYYKAKTPPAELEGITTSKFAGPDETEGYDSTFAVGAGVSLATAQDSGKAFSCKLFLLLSLPDLIYLEGKANILGERVGITGEDPPFFAMLAISPQSVETGFGVNYQLPKEENTGWILDLNAEMRAAFFFQNSSAWYINFGTEQNPTTARVLSLFDATAYVMISAAGIRAGAGVTFGFSKSYAGGMVRASVGVYIKVGGFISFKGPQIGGSAMLGGHVDVSLLGFGFYLVIDTSLSVEAPKPFYIRGTVHLCVGITIGFWKFKKRIEKCFDVEFTWAKNNSVDTSPVPPFRLPTPNPEDPSPLKAVNMLSGETFNLMFIGTSLPSANVLSFERAVVPLDSWIDLEFQKGLQPEGDVNVRIGRLSGQAAANHIDLVPPVDVPHQVRHEYSITAVEIKAWSGSEWVDYRPYQAMSSPAALAALKPNATAYKDGFWQNSGAGFSKLRLLAETSFSYMEQGQPGWYVPEQFGITSATLFCRTKLRGKHCLRWGDVAVGTVYPADAWRQVETMLFEVSGGPGTVIDWNSPFDIPRSLAFANQGVCRIVFNKPCVEVDLKLTAFSAGAVIRFYERRTAGAEFIHTLVETRSLSAAQLLAPVQYNNPAVPVVKVEIDPVTADPAAIRALEARIAGLYRQLYEGTGGVPADVLRTEIRGLEEQHAALMLQGSMPDGFSRDALARELLELQARAAQCDRELAVLEAARDAACAEAGDLRARLERCFPQPPSMFSFEVIEERPAEGAPEFRYLLYDDRADAVLLQSVRRYGDAAAAERGLFETLELARRPGAYAFTRAEAGEYSFQLLDVSPGIAAASPMLFGTADALMAYAQDARVRVHAAQTGNAAPLVRRTAGRLPRDERLEFLDCWSGLPAGDDAGDCPCCAEQCCCCRTGGAGGMGGNRVIAYRDLYTRIRQLLEQKTRACEEAARVAAEKVAECRSLSDQQEAIELLIGKLDQGGAWHPPDGFSTATLLHEVCCHSLEDYEFNRSVPEQGAVEQDYLNASAAIEKMLTPIWRPDTKYSVHLRVTDTVDRGAAAGFNFYFGFRTAGPVGHFHTDSEAHYLDTAQGRTPDQYMLTGLKGYIDYQRSYPNADGQLVGAKPLFYEDARILLFFTKRYTYHFFGDWPAYNGLSALTGAAMQIIIKDPAEDISIPNPPPPLVTTTRIPRAVVEWKQDNDPRIPEDVRTLLSLRSPELLNPEYKGGECWTSGGKMIQPASVYTAVTPQYLKPLKLYTAVVNNVYKGRIQEVHRYVFQTSRYPDFDAQVRSYRLDDGHGNRRDAVFGIDVSLTAADITLMRDIVTVGTTSAPMSAANAALAGTWADPFDRLVEGTMKLAPLDAAVTTEFNVVRSVATSAAVAVWIRSPEPFNDPKLPDGVLARGLCVMNGSAPDPNYVVLFSKDRSQAFVMHRSTVIPAATLRFRFIYIEWDGKVYVDRTVVATGAIALNI